MVRTHRQQGTKDGGTRTRRRRLRRCRFGRRRLDVQLVWLESGVQEHGRCGRSSAATELAASELGCVSNRSLTASKTDPKVRSQRSLNFARCRRQGPARVRHWHRFRADVALVPVVKVDGMRWIRE